jgi:hypothetical protein
MGQANLTCHDAETKWKAVTLGQDVHSLLGSIVPTLGLGADMRSLGMHEHRAIFPKWLEQCEISKLHVATFLLLPKC